MTLNSRSATQAIYGRIGALRMHSQNDTREVSNWRLPAMPLGPERLPASDHFELASPDRLPSLP